MSYPPEDAIARYDGANSSANFPKAAIPCLEGEEWAGVDLRTAPPLHSMLAGLAACEFENAYSRCWLSLAGSIGCSVSVSIDRAGKQSLMFALPSDAQENVRASWLDVLRQDLNAAPARRGALIDLLVNRGRFVDNRRAVSSNTVGRAPNGSLTR